MGAPAVLPTVAALRALVARWRAAGERVALVPTMGALHAGHLALADAARAAGAARIVASIFVNPTQFLPGEDLAAYPRPFAADLAALTRAGVDAVFHPDAEEMYPPGFALTLRPGGPALAGLEDRARPGHFDGVATVVAKLLIAAAPDAAAFGEKDWQQLCVVRRLVADLALPVTILPVPTVREADGLALSSRNAYLSGEERARAPALHRALTAAAARLAAGEAAGPVLAEARAGLEREGFMVDYVEARDAAGLGAPAPGRPVRLLAAARLGRTRLIDNLAVPEHAP